MLNFANLENKSPGYVEIAEAIIEAVNDGRLAANSPLPPSRVLASSLGVSRDTVLRTYSHLKNLGWTYSHGTRGTFIKAAAEVQSRGLTPTPLDKERISGYTRKLIADSERLYFSPEPVAYGSVLKEFLPIKRWKEATRRNVEPISPLHYDAAVIGHPELRSAIASFLNHTRGISCHQDEVSIFNISFNAMTLICRLFLEPGELIAIEEPGFGGARDVAAFLGLETLPIPLDSEGISVDFLKNCNKPVKMVYVTPNHQEPTGCTMSLARRKELLSWAQRNNALIIEDEYDCIFHYGATMPAALKSMDTQDNVIYLSSFWQTLYPLTTLCFAVLPPSIVEIVDLGKRNTASLTESVTQLALAEILNDGYLQKHTRKLEREFAARRSTLIYELKRCFGSAVDIPSKTGGLTFIARFLNQTDQDLIDATTHANLSVASTEAFYCDLSRRPTGELLFYFAGLEQTQIRRSVEKMRSFLKK